MDAFKLMQIWRKNVKDKTLADEIDSLTQEECLDCFYKELEFGTGGLRGKVGVGTNRLNIYTIAKISQGVAAYVLKNSVHKIAISYDSRINSRIFAETASRVFASNGIVVVIVNDIMPTPFLSFITREYGCGAGIMITASHNPAEYNGYKVYDAAGCQVTDTVAQEISEYIRQGDYFNIPSKSFGKFCDDGMIQVCDETIVVNYLQGVKSIGDRIPINNISVTYSPLNGAGYRLLPRLLTELGIGNLKMVSAQIEPNGQFPTCRYPNPEKEEALAMGLIEASKNESDLLLVTDPDADRIGVAVRDKSEYRHLSGNEVGILLTNYLLEYCKIKGTLPIHPIVLKTIVTSDMVYPICSDYNCKVVEVLTGFKYIGEQIEHLKNKKDFVLGFEESCGYLIGTQVRDKDALVAARFICEMTAYYKNLGVTLCDVLELLYRKYGKYINILKTKKLEGEEGHSKINSFMSKIRNGKIHFFDGWRLTDYLVGETTLPRSNVAQFENKSGIKVIVRPSGTEPILKFYLSACIKTEKDKNCFSRLEKQLEAIIQDI